MFITMCIWFLFFWFTVWTAKDYGRSQFLWGILGLLFGVFALILLLVLGRKNYDNYYDNY